MYGNLVQVCLCSWDSKMEIPPGDSFTNPLRSGFLQKIVGRGWLYSGSWKKRYCVLHNHKLYFYENQNSRGSEKSCGVINLDCYDVCEEGKDKKNPHVFVLGTSVKGFFDTKHQFAAETPEDLQAWIRDIQSSVAEARDKRKSARKQQDENSPSVENTSQELEGSAPLVTATKDRARGPQGRRLPQRKSMMPTGRPVETSDMDIRMRSISLSTPPIDAVDEADELDMAVRHNTSGDKWLSQSLEEVDRGRESESHRSSSVFDVAEDPQPPQKKKIFGINPLGNFSALTRELEMKLKPRRPPEENVEEDVIKEVQVPDHETSRRLESLSQEVEVSREALSTLDARVDQLATQVEASGGKVGDVLLQVTVTLKEAERINGECKRALEEANKARTEYQLLAKECKETLRKLNSPADETLNGYEK